MTNFWSPYANMADAAKRIGRFADRAVGPGYGLTWSDGYSVAILRKAHTDAHGHGAYLNVLREHISAPPPPPPPPASHSGFLASAESFFHHAEVRGEQLVKSGEHAVKAGGQEFMTHVWNPAHNYLLAHKKAADGVSVAIDVVGVVAGLAFIIALTPEIGALAIITGVAAAGGSILLLAADGAVFGTEVTGHAALSERLENSHVVQWMRIVGTVGTLIDLPVGGVRALADVGKFGSEARTAVASARDSDALAEAARARAGKIRNPTKHPGPLNRRLHKVNKLVAAAEKHRHEAQALTHRMRVIAARDVTASFVATPVGTALMAASPPSMLLSTRQRETDANLMKLLEPEHGMPKDFKLQVRVSSLGKVPQE